MRRIRLTVGASAVMLALGAAGPSTAATRLVATVGPGATITLPRQLHGQVASGTLATRPSSIVKAARSRVPAERIR